jgi:hypothetical protein
MVEFSAMSVLAGTLEFVKVPTDSGNVHWVVRCAGCRTAMWNEHGSRNAVIRYVRVGTLDEPSRLAPRAHIYVRSKQPWVMLDPAVPAFDGAYDRRKQWPAPSVARLEQARVNKAAARGRG